jgi:preprotein translocase subunit SecF
MKLNILGKRYWFFLLSLAMILPGLIIIAVNGLPLSIDFTGGSMEEVQFSSTATVPQLADITSLYSANGITDIQVQFSANDSKPTVVIKSTSMTQDQHAAILSAMKTNFDANLIEMKFDTVGPSISKSVHKRALLAIGVSALAVIIYITFAFAASPMPSVTAFAPSSR